MRTDHIFRSDMFIKLFHGQESKLVRGLTEREVLLMGVFRYAGCRVVADDRVEGGDQHQGLVEVASNPAVVHRDTADAVLGERRTHVPEKSGGLQDGMDDDRLEYVQFELTAAAGHTDCYVVTHHLGCYHRHRLTLCWVHLT